MSLRCSMGIHGDPVYHYDDFAAYCERCGVDLGPTDALLFLTEKTVDKWEGHVEGDVEAWELEAFIEEMWDTGYEDGIW